MQPESFRNAWGEFLSLLAPWDWFVTLTFRGLVPSFRAYLLFAKFCRDVEKAAGMPIAWFRGDEYGARGGRLHFHVLMVNVAHLRRLYWMDEWERLAGWARIREYDKSQGGAFYVAKYVTKSQGEWDLSGLPLAVQTVLPLPIVGKADASTIAAASVRLHGPVEPVTARRRRPDRLCWHRRDWEDEMIRSAGRWREPAENFAVEESRISRFRKL